MEIPFVLQGEIYFKLMINPYFYGYRIDKTFLFYYNYDRKTQG